MFFNSVDINVVAHIYPKSTFIHISAIGATTGNISLQPPSQVIDDISAFLMQTMDGFVFMLDADGKLIYISENASGHLGGESRSYNHIVE
jgi:hypothetical protein